ncbi:MAG: hypothetical protein AAFV53_29120 [Myxococcota bacterium]
MRAAFFIICGLACKSTASAVEPPVPMPPEALNVGVSRVAVVLAVSAGRDLEEDAFQRQIAAFERKGIAPQVHWLGCQPELVQAVNKGEEHWIASVAFPDRRTAETWLTTTKNAAIAVAEGIIEACGD